MENDLDYLRNFATQVFDSSEFELPEEIRVEGLRDIYESNQGRLSGRPFKKSFDIRIVLGPSNSNFSYLKIGVSKNLKTEELDFSFLAVRGDFKKGFLDGFLKIGPNEQGKYLKRQIEALFKVLLEDSEDIVHKTKAKIIEFLDGKISTYENAAESA